MCSVVGHEFAIEIAGARTKRGWSNAVLADLVLGTSRLKGVREHRWSGPDGDGRRGTPWAMMQRDSRAWAVRRARSAVAGAGDGGRVCGSNDSGALRLKYGSLRDLIIGMTMVLAERKRFEASGEVTPRATICASG